MSYHLREIKPQGVIGEFSKIEEELDEVREAIEQNNKIMTLIELSDLIGAIEHYSLNKFGISLNDLVTMKTATDRAFTTGHRENKQKIKHQLMTIGTDKMINYNNIAKAVEYYTKNGFKYIEVPWWVQEEAKNITAPKDRSSDFKIRKNKYLIASGEQGFLYLATKGLIAEDINYVTVTPCYREEQIDILHQKCFMKCELFCLSPSGIQNTYDYFVQTAFGFFSSLTDVDISIKVLMEEKKTCDILGPTDLQINKKEIGSYGYREHNHLKWTYGTGIAEPRFSNIIKSL